jgi:hypothetical protein
VYRANISRGCWFCQWVQRSTTLDVHDSQRTSTSHLRDCSISELYMRLTRWVCQLATGIRRALPELIMQRAALFAVLMAPPQVGARAPARLPALPLPPFPCLRSPSLSYASKELVCHPLVMPCRPNASHALQWPARGGAATKPEPRYPPPPPLPSPPPGHRLRR